MPQPPAALLAAPFPFVYAIGPLGPDGGLLPHPGAGRPYGGAQLTLRGDGAAPAPEPVPAAADSEAAPPPPQPRPQPAAAAAPAAPSLEGSADLSGCQLEIGDRQLSFAACTPIQGIGKDFQLMWSLEPASDGNTSTVVLGLRASTGGSQWVAVGFPASPSRMLGATAFVLKACPTCPSGAEMRDCFLAARSPAGVQPPGRLPVSDASAAASGDGFLQGTIKVQLDSAAAANPSLPIILAAGPLDASGGLLQHSDRGSSSVDLASGTSRGVQGESAHITHLKNAHGWLMAVGWGLLIPLGILVARHGKDWDPLWFHLHRGVQILGLSCALSGFVIIFIAVKEATGSSVSIYTVHCRLGISAMILGLAQLTALVFRPHKGTRLRPYWEFLHHWVGRAAAVVAAANIYEGIINVRHVGTWATVTYSVVFGLIMATGIGLDLWKLLTGRRHLFTRRQPVQLQAPGGGSSAGGSGSKRGGAGEAAEPHPV